MEVKRWDWTQTLWQSFQTVTDFNKLLALKASKSVSFTVIRTGCWLISTHAFQRASSTRWLRRGIQFPIDTRLLRWLSSVAARKCWRGNLRWRRCCQPDELDPMQNHRHVPSSTVPDNYPSTPIFFKRVGGLLFGLNEYWSWMTQLLLSMYVHCSFFLTKDAMKALRL